MKKFVIAGVAVILICLFLSTFIEESNLNKANNKNNIVMSVDDVNYNLGEDLSASKDNENIICATCRGLVKLNSNNEITLDIAKDLEISNDGIEYKFTLRDDALWSNGQKIKPEEVIDYFKELIQKEDNMNIKALLSVYGVDRFKEGKVNFERDVAMKSDENTIKMRLNKKDDNFLYELSKPQYRVRRNLNLWGDLSSNYNRIVYSGNYCISNVKQDKIELNNKNDVTGKKIIMLKDESKEQSMAAYEVGDRDVVIDVPMSQASRLDENKKVLSSSSGEGIYILINSEKMNLDMRKEFVKNIYKAAQEYCNDNKISVKFSEGSYFEKEMDELDKLQSRKVNVSNGGQSEVPSKINVLIDRDDVSENFIRFLVDYFKENESVNIVYKEEGEEALDNENFYAAVFRLKEDSSKKNDLYNGMQKVFKKENGRYFLDSNNIEGKIFDSYIALPVMFVNRNIAVSDKVENVKLDGNGNIDFSELN